MDFISPYKDFCKSNSKIQGVWYLVNEEKKDIIVCTVIDDLDFELEYEIYNNHYSFLPVIDSGFYLELRVEPSYSQPEKIDGAKEVYIRGE